MKWCELWAWYSAKSSWHDPGYNLKWLYEAPELIFEGIKDFRFHMPSVGRKLSSISEFSLKSWWTPIMRSVRISKKLLSVISVIMILLSGKDEGPSVSIHQRLAEAKKFLTPAPNSYEVFNSAYAQSHGANKQTTPIIFPGAGTRRQAQARIWNQALALCG